MSPCGQRRSGGVAATRGSGEGVRGGGKAGDARGAEGEATGDDLKLAALSGMDMPVVATPLAMPTSA